MGEYRRHSRHVFLIHFNDMTKLESNAVPPPGPIMASGSLPLQFLLKAVKGLTEKQVPKFLDRGMDDFLIFPIDREILLQKVQHWIAHARAEPSRPWQWSLAASCLIFPNICKFSPNKQPKDSQCLYAWHF